MIEHIFFISVQTILFSSNLTFFVNWIYKMNHIFLSKETVNKLSLIGLEQQCGLVKLWRWNQENRAFFPTWQCVYASSVLSCGVQLVGLDLDLVISKDLFMFYLPHLVIIDGEKICMKNGQGSYQSAWTDRRCQRWRRCGAGPPGAFCLGRPWPPLHCTRAATCRGWRWHRRGLSKSAPQRKKGI